MTGASTDITFHYPPELFNLLVDVVHRRAPWKNRESVELATLEWVAWFNHQRLHSAIGYVPPAEAEANYYYQLGNTAEHAVLL